MSIGQEIRRRRLELGLSQAELAQKVGTHQQTIEKIEGGKIQHSRYFPGISAALNLPRNGNPQPAPVAKTPVAENPIPGNMLMGARDLPVHAAVEGGKGQLIVSTDPVDWELRPAPLANVKGAYGLIVIGESMSPEFEPGDIALINPHLPPIRGKTCIFYTESEHGEASATVKRLVKFTEDLWHVRQWNPADGEKNDFTLSRRLWTRCHRIIGKYNAR